MSDTLSLLDVYAWFDPNHWPAPVLSAIAERLAADAPFSYVVTPNVDHIVRLSRRPELLALYDAAWLRLNDSRVLQLLARVSGYQLPLVRGSDLVASLLDAEALRQVPITVIGGENDVMERLRARHPGRHWRHLNPPMGFYRHENLIQETLAFLDGAPPGLILLGVGSPQQEALAYRCRERGLNGRVALCVGAALRMYAGLESRAPAPIRSAGLEWLYRMLQDPRRLATRYLRDDVAVFGLWLQSFRDKAALASRNPAPRRRPV